MKYICTIEKCIVTHKPDISNQWCHTCPYSIDKDELHKMISLDKVFALFEKYDKETGEYPESYHEGESMAEFFKKELEIE